MPHPLLTQPVCACRCNGQGCRRRSVDSPELVRRRRQLAFQTSAKLPPEIEPGWARTAELLLFVMTISFGE